MPESLPFLRTLDAVRADNGRTDIARSMGVEEAMTSFYLSRTHPFSRYVSNLASKDSQST